VSSLRIPNFSNSLLLTEGEGDQGVFPEYDLFPNNPP
jgi:hypothetical protein